MPPNFWVYRVYISPPSLQPPPRPPTALLVAFSVHPVWRRTARSTASKIASFSPNHFPARHPQVRISGISASAKVNECDAVLNVCLKNDNTIQGVGSTVLIYQPWTAFTIPGPDRISHVSPLNFPIIAFPPLSICTAHSPSSCTIAAHVLPPPLGFLIASSLHWLSMSCRRKRSPRHPRRPLCVVPPGPPGLLPPSPRFPPRPPRAGPSPICPAPSPPACVRPSSPASRGGLGWRGGRGDGRRWGKGDADKGHILLVVQHQCEGTRAPMLREINPPRQTPR